MFEEGADMQFLFLFKHDQYTEKVISQKTGASNHHRAMRLHFLDNHLNNHRNVHSIFLHHWFKP